MNCPACGTANEERNRYCYRCGRDLPRGDRGEGEPPRSGPPSPEPPRSEPTPPVPPPIRPAAAGAPPGSLQAPPPPGPPDAALPYLSAPGWIEGSLREGWDAIRRHPLVVAAVPVLAMAVQIMVQAGLVSSARDHFFLLFGWSFVVSILWAIFYAGYNYAVLRVLRNEPVSSDDFLRGVTRFPQLAVAGVLFYLAVTGGAILFVLPGIILGLGFAPAFLLILDRPGIDPVEAMRISWRRMRGRKLEFLLLQLALGGINLLGAIPLGLGLLLTIPWSFASCVAFYRRVFAGPDPAPPAPRPALSPPPGAAP